jgi:hypothetical protein
LSVKRRDREFKRRIKICDSTRFNPQLFLHLRLYKNRQIPQLFYTYAYTKATNFVFPNTNESGNRIYPASEISKGSTPGVIKFEEVEKIAS